MQATSSLLPEEPSTYVAQRDTYTVSILITLEAFAAARHLLLLSYCWWHHYQESVLSVLEGQEGTCWILSSFSTVPFGSVKIETGWNAGLNVGIFTMAPVSGTVGNGTIVVSETVLGIGGQVLLLPSEELP